MNSTSLKGAGTHVNLRAAPNPHVGGHYAPAKRHIRRLWITPCGAHIRRLWITPCGALLMFFTFSQKSEGDWRRSKLQAHEMCMKVTIRNFGSQRPNLPKGRARAHIHTSLFGRRSAFSLLQKHPKSHKCSPAAQNHEKMQKLENPDKIAKPTH